MKKIIFAGDFKAGSNNTAQANALERNGAMVVECPYMDISKKIGYKKRNQTILERVRDAEPDILLIDNGNTISLETLEECKKVCKIVLWYAEDLFDNNGTGLKDRIKLANKAYFAHKKPYDIAVKVKGFKKVKRLRTGYDPEAYKVLPRVGADKFPIYKASQIGKLTRLVQEFHKDVKFANLVMKDYSKGISIAVAQSDINLVFVEKGKGCPDLVYKIMASGGFVVAQPWAGIEDDFEVGKDLVTFDTVEELQEIMTSDTCGTRDEIAQSGHKSVKKYSMDEWAKEIVGGK